MLQMVFMVCGFTSRGQELGSVFSAAVCKIQAGERYIESLPLVLKDKRSCFSQGEKSTVQLPLHCEFALQKQDTYLTIGNHSYKLTHCTGANTRRHQQWQGDGEDTFQPTPGIISSGRVMRGHISAHTRRHQQWQGDGGRWELLSPAITVVSCCFFQKGLVAGEEFVLLVG